MARRRWHARPLAERRLRRPRPRLGALLGWVSAGAVLVVLALVVGRPAVEQGVLGGTPSPSLVPIAIVFGIDLDPATNQAIGETRRFRAGDAFAYSVTLPGSPGTDEILVQVARLEPGGRRTVVQEPSVQEILPRLRTFAFRVATSDLLAAWGAGDFEMTIWIDLDDPPLAVGRFTLLATPS